MTIGQRVPRLLTMRDGELVNDVRRDATVDVTVREATHVMERVS